MSRWLLLVMIVLLPLRGWAGDAMAAEMSARQVQNAAVAVASQGQAPHHEAAHDDCAGHALDPQAGPAAQDADCPTCAMCQACSALALVSFAADTGAAAPGQQHPSGAFARFASADEARGFKPPIF